MEKKRAKKEQRTFAWNSFYSLLSTYSRFIFSIVISFLIARLISQREWGFLILALSYITLISLVKNYLPPSLADSYRFYIPKFRALGQNRKIKSFIKNSIYLRCLFIIPIYLIANILFLILSDWFILLLGEYYNLLFILGSLILIEGIGKELFGINAGFNLINVSFIIRLAENIIKASILVYFLIFFNNVDIEMIAFVYVISALFPFIINFSFILYYVIFKIEIEKDDVKKISFRETFKLIIKYGSHLSLSSILVTFFDELKIQSIGFLGYPEWVTGFNISMNYRRFSSQTTGSFTGPLVMTLTSLNTKNQWKQIKKMYRLLFLCYSLIFLFFTGLLYFLSDFFLFFVYGEEYLKFSLLIKLLLFQNIFGAQGILFYSILKSSKMVKYIIPISTVILTIRIILFVIFLFIFGIIGSAIALILGMFVSFVVLILLGIKLLNIKPNTKKTAELFFCFFLAFFITLFLDDILFQNISILLLKQLNLFFFRYIPFLSILSFLCLFTFLVLFFGIFNKRDIEIIKEVFNKKKYFQGILVRILDFIKKLLPS
mgnify:CR=1 FL=1